MAVCLVCISGVQTVVWHFYRIYSKKVTVNYWQYSLFCTVCVCVCARSPCNPPSLLVHYSLVTNLLLHTLTWWAPALGCGPAWDAASPVHKVSWLSRVEASVSQLLRPHWAAQGTWHHLQGSVLACSNHSTPSRLQRAKPDGTCLSGLLESRFDKFQHSFYPVPTFSTSSPARHIWFFLILEDGYRVSGVSVACWQPLQPGWCWQVRDRGRHPPLEFVTVFFMVSSFYLRNYLSTGKDVIYSVLKEIQVTIWFSSLEMELKNVCIISISLYPNHLLSWFS